ncbi:TRAP transporter permease [Desulfocicer niacini]
MERKNFLAYAVIFISLCFTGFQVFTATNGLMTSLLQRSIHLSFALILVFLLFPFTRKSRATLFMDIPFALMSLASGLYLYISFDDLIYRIGEPTTWDIFFGVSTIILLLEATRRMVGYTMTTLGVISLLYCLLGNYLPEPFGHSGRDLGRVLSQMYLSTEGIFGLPLGVAATYVFIFILFGSFMEKSGAGALFINLANAFTGKYKGGSAKVAIISSMSFGMVSGSPVSDAATTGAFTIPLMKKMGYAPNLAAGFEAAAASGASLVPPVMGAGAFVMADITGVPYSNIIVHAIIPAFIYYAALMFVAGNEARKGDIKCLPDSEIPTKKHALMNSLRLLIPLFILILSLAVLRVSPLRAALYATGIIVSLTLCYNYFKPEMRVPMKDFYDAMLETPRKILVVSVACGTAGLIIGMLGLTGLGLKLSDILMGAAQGQLFIGLIFAMLISLVLGMGLPPTACYIIMAVTVAPALVHMGLPVIVAHFFVFMYCCYAPITPPVALAAYTTAGIAYCDPFKAGLSAFRIGLSGFILPFFIAYGYPLLCIGSWSQIIWSFITAIMGVYFMSISNVGWFYKKVSTLWRIILCVGSLLLISPGIYTDIIGFSILTIFIITNGIFFNKNTICQQK